MKCRSPTLVQVDTTEAVRKFSLGRSQKLFRVGVCRLLLEASHFAAAMKNCSCETKLQLRDKDDAGLAMIFAGAVSVGNCDPIP